MKVDLSASAPLHLSTSIDLSWRARRRPRPRKLHCVGLPCLTGLHACCLPLPARATRAPRTKMQAPAAPDRAPLSPLPRPTSARMGLRFLAASALAALPAAVLGAWRRTAGWRSRIRSHRAIKVNDKRRHQLRARPARPAAAAVPRARRPAGGGARGSSSTSGSSWPPRGSGSSPRRRRSRPGWKNSPPAPT